MTLERGTMKMMMAAVDNDGKQFKDGDNHNDGRMKMEKMRRARRLIDLGEDKNFNDNDNAAGGHEREKEGTECQSDDDREEN
jgi:hypothetical protein